LSAPVFFDELADVAVELVALLGTELRRRHLVMLHDGVVVGGDPFHREFFGAVLVFVDDAEAAGDRLGRGRVTVNLAPDLVIDLEIFFDGVPRFLRNH